MRTAVYRAFLGMLIAGAGLPRLLRWLRGSPLLARLTDRLGPGSTCLERSLWSVARSARDGGASRLALGVRKTRGRLEAHAWVERPGDSPSDREGFRRLGSL